MESVISVSQKRMAYETFLICFYLSHKRAVLRLFLDYLIKGSFSTSTVFLLTGFINRSSLDTVSILRIIQPETFEMALHRIKEDSL